MSQFEAYTTSFWGIFAILATVLLQWFIAIGPKASQAGAIPGKIDENLGHASFVFRAHRTFMNSLENVPTVLGTSFLAVFVGAKVLCTAIFIWVFALA